MANALKLNNNHPFNVVHLYLLRLTAHKTKINQVYESYLTNARHLGLASYRDRMLEPITGELTAAKERELLEEIDPARGGDVARSAIFTTDKIPVPVNAIAAIVSGVNPDAGKHDHLRRTTHERHEKPRNKEGGKKGRPTTPNTRT